MLTLALAASAPPAGAGFSSPEAVVVAPAQGALVLALGFPPPATLAYLVHIQNVTSYDVTLRDASGTVVFGTHAVGAVSCNDHLDVPGAVPFGSLPRPYAGQAMVRIEAQSCFGPTLVHDHTFTLIA